MKWYVGRRSVCCDGSSRYRFRVSMTMGCPPRRSLVCFFASPFRLDSARARHAIVRSPARGARHVPSRPSRYTQRHRQVRAEGDSPQRPDDREHSMVRSDVCSWESRWFRALTTEARSRPFPISRNVRIPALPGGLCALEAVGATDDARCNSAPWSACRVHRSGGGLGRRRPDRRDEG